MPSFICGIEREMIQMYSLEKETHRLKRMNPWLPGDREGGRMEGRDRQGVRLGLTCPRCYIMGNQQGPAGQHGELCSLSRGTLDGRAVWGKWTRVYVSRRSPFTLHLKSAQCGLVIGCIPQYKTESFF